MTTLTIPCRFFNSQGGCHKGGYCRFSHEEEKLEILDFCSSDNTFKHEAEYVDISNNKKYKSDCSIDRICTLSATSAINKLKNKMLLAKTDDLKRKLQQRENQIDDLKRQLEESKGDVKDEVIKRRRIEENNKQSKLCVV